MQPDLRVILSLSLSQPGPDPKTKHPASIPRAQTGAGIWAAPPPPTLRNSSGPRFLQQNASLEESGELV